ncbi:MAG: carboxypeptidase M32, partial [Desulfurococcaceae archaeon]
YSEGILQDIHWSMGSIGYFPTYTLGNIIAASMRYAMENEIKLKEKIANSEFKIIQDWQRSKIHRYGSTYPPKVLLRKAIGVDYEPEHLIKYLSEKYLSAP